MLKDGTPQDATVLQVGGVDPPLGSFVQKHGSSWLASEHAGNEGRELDWVTPPPSWPSRLTPRSHHGGDALWVLTTKLLTGF